MFSCAIWLLVTVVLVTETASVLIHFYTHRVFLPLLLSLTLSHLAPCPDKTARTAFQDWKCLFYSSKFITLAETNCLIHCLCSYFRALSEQRGSCAAKWRSVRFIRFVPLCRNVFSLPRLKLSLSCSLLVLLRHCLPKTHPEMFRAKHYPKNTQEVFLRGSSSLKICLHLCVCGFECVQVC